MNIAIQPCRLGGTVEAPFSKSCGHRLLIAAALSDKPTVLELDASCDDIKITINALTRMGAEIRSLGEKELLVKPIEEMPCTRTLDCGESGTTLRLLLPLAAALGCNGFTYRGSQRLAGRPLEPLLRVMRRHGVLVSGETLPLRVSGQLHGGIYRLPGDVSSQFVSALLFALPLLIADSVIELEGPLCSAPYVDMTLEVLQQFGVKIRREGNRFSVSGRQTFRSPGKIAAERDWSGAAFLLAGGAMGKGVVVEGLNEDSLQGDRKITELLRLMAGEEPSPAKTAVLSGKKALGGCEIDAGDIPDLVPVLAVLACAAKGKTVIYNASRLRTKESDRLKALCDGLGALGADIKETADGLEINGKGSLKGGKVSCCGDHRIVMAMALAASVCKNRVVLEGAEAVTKSYPAFFDDFKALGGKCDVL